VWATNIAASDEVFFQTALFNSPFANTTTLGDVTQLKYRQYFLSRVACFNRLSHILTSPSPSRDVPRMQASMLCNVDITRMSQH
jgi:hypothetical protein